MRTKLSYLFLGTPQLWRLYAHIAGFVASRSLIMQAWEADAWVVLPVAADVTSNTVRALEISMKKAATDAAMKNAGLFYVIVRARF